MRKPALALARPIDDPKVHEAYSELESYIRDLERMAILASQVAEDSAGNWASPNLHQEMLQFTVFDVEKRAEALRKKYYALWEAAGG